MLSGFQCAGCGEWNETQVDSSAGSRQNYVEDCQVCCKPNILRIMLGQLLSGVHNQRGTGVTGSHRIIFLVNRCHAIFLGQMPDSINRRKADPPPFMGHMTMQPQRRYEMIE